MYWVTAILPNEITATKMEQPPATSTPDSLFYLMDELYSDKIVPISFSMQRYKSAWMYFRYHGLNIGIAAGVLFLCLNVFTRLTLIATAICLVLTVTIIGAIIGLPGLVGIALLVFVFYPSLIMNYIAGVIQTIKVRTEPFSVFTVLIPQKEGFKRRLGIFYSIILVCIPLLLVALLCLLIPIIGGLVAATMLIITGTFASLLAAPMALLMTMSYKTTFESLKVSLNVLRLNFKAFFLYGLVTATWVLLSVIFTQVVGWVAGFIPYGIGFIADIAIAVIVYSFVPICFLAEVVAAAQAMGLGNHSFIVGPTMYQVEPSAPAF
ncbi:multi-sensor hybrid histidine kinase [Carpediemonas membranifera]|uniref:Multi-sensor hybrid histidine kinase n=1 Tax=Carpediemonas membranifera TaxID=201153 RepID=A0A8J6E0Q4_9EUKA|nr:multi-sensor hybrid histidine kinase [Carpediemonas membranifera]|eukprot:KAG9395409.1 multi-sensor hybrid histidine kinase [Carpediemonas membranifera]